MDPDDYGWFAVRCVIASGNPPSADANTYGERITLWRAATPEMAIERAEAEARRHAGAIEDAPDTVLGFSQSFHLFDDPVDGAEIFSLLRDSELNPTDYLNRFFDTGREYQQHIEPPAT